MLKNILLPIGVVTGIYSTGRFRKMADGYEKTPWEGRFREHTHKLA